MEILELAQFTAICHTNGCENKDIDIEITAPKENPYVICGPCNTHIQDVK